MFLHVLHFRFVRQQRVDGHDNARRAKAALGAVKVDHGRLEGVETTVTGGGVLPDGSDALDGGDVGAVGGQNGHEAGIGRVVDDLSFVSSLVLLLIAIAATIAITAIFARNHPAGDHDGTRTTAALGATCRNADDGIVLGCEYLKLILWIKYLAQAPPLRKCPILLPFCYNAHFN